jgi:hypothetical protein
MEKISIELLVHEWNIVMQALAKRPYEEVVDLIREIKRQGDANLAATTQSDSKTDELNS